MQVPAPTIYLRNQFTVKANHESQFLYGKENLIRNTFPEWRLVAACGERLVLEGTSLPEPAVSMMQIWRVKGWNSLYDNVYKFSETGWYMSLGNSLESEKQELLVGVLGGDSGAVPPRWEHGNDDPGYRYLYEEALPQHGRTHAYLRHVNWFASEVGSRSGQGPGHGWTRVWAGLQVTAAPSTIALLWRVPGDLDDIDETIRRKFGAGANANRYREMVACLRTLSRQLLYPAFPERIAQLVAENPKRAPIVKAPDNLF